MKQNSVSVPKMVIVVRKDLNMRKGKIAAQVGHAVMKSCIDVLRRDNLFLSELEHEWFWGLSTKIVVGIDTEAELIELIMRADEVGIKTYPITDAGKTEFHGEPTLTCAAFGPALPDDIDVLTKDLKLL